MSSPLVAANGHRIGLLCFFDIKLRRFAQAQVRQGDEAGHQAAHMPGGQAPSTGQEHMSCCLWHVARGAACVYPS